MKKWFVVLITISFSINAMRVNPEDFGSRADAGAAASATADEQVPVIVDKTFVVRVRENDFQAFISAKKGQRSTLKSVTGLPFIGRAVSGILEGFGVVEDTDHAITFLDRMFEDENAFLQTIDQLEEDDANITYLQAVFARLGKGAISKDELIHAMRAERHQHVPEPDKMGEKTDDDSYVVPDAHFHNWAACNCLVFHWHEQHQQEQQQQQERRPRGLKKGGSGLFKKD